MYIFSYIVIIQFFSVIYCIGSRIRIRRVAVLNRKVSTVSFATKTCYNGL